MRRPLRQQLVTRGFQLVIFLALPWVVLLAVARHGLRDLFQRFGGKPFPNKSKNRIQLLAHGASVGELRELESLCLALQADDPELANLDVVLSCTSRSAIEFHKVSPFRFRLCPYPVDTPITAKRHTTHADVIIFSRHELWPSMLNQIDLQIRSHKAKAIWLGAKSAGHGIQSWLELMIPEDTWVHPLDPSFRWFRKDRQLSTALLRSLLVHQTPNLRFGDSKLQDIVKSGNYFVAGSVYERDFLLLKHLSDRVLRPRETKLLIVPHQVGSKDLQEKYEKVFSDDLSDQAYLLDQLGVLKGLYANCRGAFVGCGHHGIHNALEPLLFDKPTFYFGHSGSLDATKVLGGAAEMQQLSQMNVLKTSDSMNGLAVMVADALDHGFQEKTTWHLWKSRNLQSHQTLINEIRAIIKQNGRSARHSQSS